METFSVAELKCYTGMCSHRIRGMCRPTLQKGREDQERSVLSALRTAALSLSSYVYTVSKKRHWCMIT